MPLFTSRKIRKNYDFFSGFSWYTPGIGGLFAVLAWFLAGMLLGALVMLPVQLGATGLPASYVFPIVYIVQFLPVFIFTKHMSSRNAAFETGYVLDNNHFGKSGGPVLAILAALGILGTSVMLESVNHFLPDMSETWKNTMKMMMDSPLWLTLLCVCVFAPIFEEWLCRGIVLRGLLNYAHMDAEGNPVRGMSPSLAIVISALFFAVIHGNLWQGISAFAMGCVMGYVYYRTGSLKLTMLMHFTNNFLSTMLGHFGGKEVEDAKSLVDVMPHWEYAILFAIGLGLFLLLIRALRKVPLQHLQGNSDPIDLDTPRQTDRSLP